MNFLKTKVGIQGEYRAVLRGPNGEIKSDTGWKPNLLLDQGLDLIRTESIIGSLVLGDSPIAADVSQTSLQGNVVGTYENVPYANSPTPVTPNWEKWRLTTAVFGTGSATGTINEFIFRGSYEPNTAACIRVALGTPIVKGPLDQLTIQHKLTLWPDISTKPFVYNVDGIPYNVTMQLFNCQNNTGVSTTRYSGQVNQHGVWANVQVQPTFEDGYQISDAPMYGTSLGICTQLIQTYGGSSPNFWVNGEFIYGINDGNGAINLLVLRGEGIPYHSAMFGKVSDGTPIDKFNTHELRVNFRVYPERYIP